jgi:surface antigen
MLSRTRSKFIRLIIFFAGLFVLCPLGLWSLTRVNPNPYKKQGEVIDNFEGVSIYYNGGVNKVAGRNVAPDGYNIVLKYQCVEFVKRYYYERFNHKMPDAYGHAKDFFDPMLKDGEKNIKRDLMQYQNNGSSQPRAGDILVFSGTVFNPYGHVAIVSEITPDNIEIVQQNPGPFNGSRERFLLARRGEQWYIENDRILGWLRKE